METMEITYNENALVVQANEIIRAKKDDLSLLEIKLIFLAISQIAETDTDLRTYTCKVTDLANFLNIPQDNIYRDIENLARSIVKKSIFIKDKNKPRKRNGEYNYKIFNWVDYFEYTNGIVTIRLSDKLKPYIMGLNDYLTRYGYKAIKPLPTYTSVSLFNLLSSYESLTNPYAATAADIFPHIKREKHELIFSIDFLKDYFNCKDKYPNTNHFITWVIDASVKGLNKKSPTMKVSYRTAKEGRKIGYVLFKINAWEDEDFRNFLKEKE